MKHTQKRIYYKRIVTEPRAEIQVNCRIDWDQKLRRLWQHRPSSSSDSPLAFQTRCGTLDGRRDNTGKMMQ
jgi:hypothetical protein